MIFYFSGSFGKSNNPEDFTSEAVNVMLTYYELARKNKIESHRLRKIIKSRKRGKRNARKSG